MLFTELTINTTTEGSELIADILWRYTNNGGCFAANPRGFGRA